MPIRHDEIIEDLEANIRKYGGALGEWCVGTAKDARGPFFQRHLSADPRSHFKSLTARQLFKIEYMRTVNLPQMDRVPASFGQRLQERARQLNHQR